MDAIVLASYITNWDKNIQNLIGANKKKTSSGHFGMSNINKSVP